jgi:hypothetical protein
MEKERREEETSALTPFQKMLADRAKRLEQVNFRRSQIYCAMSPCKLISLNCVK